MDILKHLDVAKGEVLEVQFAARGSSLFCLQLQYNIRIYDIYIYTHTSTRLIFDLHPGGCTGC